VRENTQVRREIELEAAPGDVWEALTRPDLLEQWFEAEVELDPRPGGAGRFVEPDGSRRAARVDDVDDGRRLAFTWWPEPGDEDAPASRVEFVLTPIEGGTRLVVTETPTIAARASVAGAAEAWTWRLELFVLTLATLAFAVE
jgi:uncharacterized protein YndB with AHSA1/START domain